MREWVVVLAKGIDYNDFWNEIENDSPDDGFVPSRRVDIVNDRPGMRRICHYLLTDAEAEELRNDDRVEAVELTVDDDPEAIFKLSLEKPFDYSRTGNNNSDVVANWGLVRCNHRDDPADTSTYTYSLDGTGVDVVIIDTGIVADHPEWEDENGVSRLQQIDWFVESGVSGTQNAGFYDDTNGHGTHCAGIAAGKTFGWAKGAHIYAIALSSFTLSGGNPMGFTTTQAFDVLLGWHNNKPIDPATGYKRPTIVNCSWSVSAASDWEPRRANWRGQTVQFTDVGEDETEFWKKTGVRPTYGGLITRDLGKNSPSLNSAMEECIDAGIHFTCAAGNDYRTMASHPSHVDYNNTFTYWVPPAGSEITAGSAWETNSPYVYGRMFYVGNINDFVDISTGMERKAGSSNSGQAVNLFAPGTSIMSATATGKAGSGSYYDNSSFSQQEMTGTSMAAPQVCGAGALVLQANPWATPEQLIAHMTYHGSKDKIEEPSTPFVNWTQATADYSDNSTVMGAANVMLYNIFNKSIPTNIG